jgi:hypothetical protein
MDPARYKTEMDKLAARRQELERMGRDVERRAGQEAASRKAMEQLEAFCGQVALGTLLGRWTNKRSSSWLDAP